MSLPNRLAAECIGTSWLVFGGCGSAILAGAFPASVTIPAFGIGFAGISLAFGLTVLTMAYAIGHISGCHLNPAVTVGLAVGRRFAWKDVIPYIVAQVVGAIIGAGVLFLIASGKEGYVAGNFACNGYGEHSLGKYALSSGLIAEIFLTFMFVMIILGATDSRAPAGFAPVAIGLGLTLIHLIGIPVTQVSVNPARSTGPALFADAWALHQLWAFWVAPIVGGIIAGIVYPIVAAEKRT